MQSLIRFIAIFDTFSVTFNQSLNPKNQSGFYKSPLGGFVSLVIYTFGLIYSINLLSSWFQNKMIMKVSSQAENYDRDIYQNIFNNSNITNFFEFYVVSNVDFEVMYDPFQEDEVIIIPLMINDTSNELTNILYYHNSVNKSLDVLLNDSMEYNGYYLIFVPCIGNEQFLSNGQQCSNQSKADEYFSASGLQIEMTMKSETINIYTKEIKTLDLYPYIFIQSQIITFYELILTYTYTEIRSGWFFTDTEYYMLKTKYDAQSNFCERGYLDNNFIFLNETATFNTTLGVIFLTTNYNIDHVIAEYPTISEMLANIGSTCQTLLLIKYIVFLINQSKMKNEFLLFCRKLYFPELSQITKITINKTEQYYLGQMQLDQIKYQHFLKQIDNKISEKLNYANLIYEISRMQVILQQIISKDINISSHNIKTKLSLDLDPKTGLHFISNYQQGCSKFKREEQILDPKYDPFIYNFSQNITRPEEKPNIKTKKQNFRSPEIAFSNVDIPIEDLNQQFSESMRPQQSI